MTSVRHTRILVAVLALICVVVFFASTKSSIAGSPQRVQPASTGEGIAIDQALDSSNTLQGTPHVGSKAPYAEVDAKKAAAGAAAADPKVYADKIASPEPAPAAVGAAAVANSGAGAPARASSGTCNSKDFVVMVDAGSTGSRVHVYEFDTCQSPPVLLNEKFDMLKPGLSSFDTDTAGAAASLDPLLKVALETVPKAKQSCTPIAVKATAGLRLLGKAKSDAILAEVRRHLENDFPFPVVDGDGISIMEGKDEGVYAWITTNYLLGNIGSSAKTPTAAVFDLGGGSTQIVFEPEFPVDQKLADGDHKYEFTFAGRDFVLYQFSHLGYGLMQGRNKVNSLVIEAHLKKEQDLVKYASKKDAKDAKATVTVSNPCIAAGVVAENVLVEVSETELYVVNMKGPSGAGASGAQCRFLSEKVLNKELECTSKPCSFNGAHQPSLTKSFKKESDMYIFSYFYDRTTPLGFPSSFSVAELSELAKLVCDGSELWKDVLFDEHIKELTGEPQWCLDLSFITALLHTGYDIPSHRELKTAKTIDRNELGWCLGASLPLLDKKTGGWKCKA